MRSRMTNLIPGALALLAATGPLRAADCAKATTQSDLNACAGQARGTADAALNAAYGDLVKAPSMADRLDRLRAAERAWVAYRDAQCAYEGAEYEGGSMQPMVIDGCAEALTARRTAELRKALSCAKSGGPC